MRKILHRVFGKFIGAFVAPTKNVEFLGVLKEDYMLLFADLNAKQYGTSYGPYYTMTDAFTFIEPSTVATITPASVVAPVATGKKRGRKSWRSLEIAF